MLQYLIITMTEEDPDRLWNAACHKRDFYHESDHNVNNIFLLNKRKIKNEFLVFTVGEKPGDDWNPLKYPDVCRMSAFRAS